MTITLYLNSGTKVKNVFEFWKGSVDNWRKISNFVKLNNDYKVCRIMGIDIGLLREVYKNGLADSVINNAKQMFQWYNFEDGFIEFIRREATLQKERSLKVIENIIKKNEAILRNQELQNLREEVSKLQIILDNLDSGSVSPETQISYFSCLNDKLTEKIGKCDTTTNFA